MRKKHRRVKKNKLFYWAVALSIISLVFLITNAIVGIILKPNLIQHLASSKEYAVALHDYGNKLYDELTTTLTFLCFFWFFIAFLLVLALVSIFQSKKNWFYFLIIAIFALFSFRWESALLLFISSFLFWKDKKINEKRKLK